MANSDSSAHFFFESGNDRLLLAIILATIYDALVAMGPFYWIPVFFGTVVVGDSLRGF